MPSADRPLFHAATSIFIILALIPSLEAILCQTGGICGAGKATSKTYINVFCDKSCYEFKCMNNGKPMQGRGCDADIRAVCPDIPSFKYKYGNSGLSFSYGPTYRIFRCFSKKCVNDMKTSKLSELLSENAKNKLDQFEKKYPFPVGPNKCEYLQYTTTTTTSKPKTTTKSVTTTNEATTVEVTPTTTNVAETTTSYGEASTTDINTPTTAGEASTTSINTPTTTGKVRNSTEEEYYDYGEEEIEVKNDGNQLGIFKVIGSILGAWIFALFL